MEDIQKVGFCVVTFNRREGLEKCLSTLFDTTENQEDSFYVVVDDHSTDGTIQYLLNIQEERRHLSLHLKPENRGYTDSFNAGLMLLDEAGCDIFFMINDDMSFLKSGWVELYIEAMKKSGIQHFNYMDGRNLVGRRNVDGINITYHHWVRGCIEVITRELFKEIGGYDPLFSEVGCMDTDFSDRAILSGFTDEHLEALFRKYLATNPSRGMGFSADVEGSRSFIHDPHPNMGEITPGTNFATKEAAVSALRRKRLTTLRPKRQKQLTVLLYHQISGGGYQVDPTIDSTSIENFRSQLEILKAMDYSFVKGADILEPDSLPEKPILITFDDGFKNNLLAQGTLKEKGATAMLFPAIKYIGSTKRTGYDLLVHALHDLPFEEVLGAYKSVASNMGIPMNDLDKGYRLRFHFRSIVPLSARDVFADELSHELEYSSDSTGMYFSYEDLRNLSPVFELGAHSLNHPLLSRLSDQELLTEIKESVRYLGDYSDITLFAYPYGYKSSFDERAKRILSTIGIGGAFSTLPVHNPLPFTNPYSLGRFSVGNETKSQFAEIIGLIFD